MPRYLRLLALLTFVAFLTVQPASPLFGQEPEPSNEPNAVDYLHEALDAASLHRFDQAIGQARGGTKCTDLMVAVAVLGDADFVASDANLNGGDGSRLCIFKDRTWNTYLAYLINQRTIADWRRAKEQFQPLVGNGGVEPCKVSQWLSTDATIRRALTQQDIFDAGTRCDPEVVSHGLKSDERLEEARAALYDAAAKAEEIYGWALVRPLHVHVYDEHDPFVNGMWKDGGHDELSPRSLEDTCGVATQIASGNMGFLLDISCFKNEGGLRALIAHEYAHIAQGGAMGSTSNLPFWAIEGGAEYFAALMVGHDQKQMTDRFREAIHDQLKSRPPALKSMVRKSSGSAELAAYSRGYAAFRFLAEFWGEDTYRSLHNDYPKGNTDRFLAGLTHITGQSLDDFDASLGTWLREQKDALPPPTPGPNTSLAAGSMLWNLTTVRPLGKGAYDENTVYTRADPALVVLMEWKCLEKSAKVDVNLITPDGAKFGTAKLTAAAGCTRLASVSGLDQGIPGRTIRSTPGTWRADVVADGRFQGSVTFVVE
jgi:hypothetical protein